MNIITASPVPAAMNTIMAVPAPVRTVTNIPRATNLLPILMQRHMAVIWKRAYTC